MKHYNLASVSIKAKSCFSVTMNTWNGEISTYIYSCFRVSSPVCTYIAHCNHSCDYSSGTAEPHCQLPLEFTCAQWFQYFNHMSDCSVRWANRTINPEMTVFIGVALVLVASSLWNWGNGLPECLIYDQVLEMMMLINHQMICVYSFLHHFYFMYTHLRIANYVLSVLLVFLL